MTTQIQERHALEAAPVEGAPGRLKIGIISSGWGSSGYYSDAVLENAATAKVFPAGTHMYFDHPSETEMYDRPERSVRDLAAVLETDGVWDPELKTIVGEAQVFGPYRELLTDKDFAKAIGTSIIASAEVTTGEAEGRKGKIITSLIEGKSVDFVTRAGRGGSILAVMESRRPERVNERAVARGVAEATANDTRDALVTLLRDTYGAEKVWIWVRDFDDTNVWFEQESPDDFATYQIGYTQAEDGAVTLDSGEPVKVRARTEYVPVAPATTSTTEAHDVSAPAGRTTPNPESEEDDMGTIQVDEAEHRNVTEAAGRVPALEAERDTAVAERDEARAELATERRRTAAGVIIDAQAREAGVSFTSRERLGLLADLPVTESGEFDEAAFTMSVTEAAAEAAEARGAGSTTGFGRTNGPDGKVSEADFDKAMPSGKGQGQEG